MPHKGAFEVRQAQKSSQEVSTSALSLMWGWPSSLWSTPKTHPPSPICPALRASRIQSLRRTPPNDCHQEGSLNTMVLRRVIPRRAKAAQLGLAPLPTSWGRGWPPGNGKEQEGGPGQRREARQTPSWEPQLQSKKKGSRSRRRLREGGASRQQVPLQSLSPWADTHSPFST